MSTNLYRFLVVVFIYILNTSCSYVKYKNSPPEIFSQIKNTLIIDYCFAPEIDPENQICARTILDGQTSSGFFVHKNSTNSFVLTAGHICDFPSGFLKERLSHGMPPGFLLQEVKVVAKIFKVVDMFYNEYNARLVDYETEYSDLCLLETELTDHPVVSLDDPFLSPGDPVRMYSAPLGSTHPGVVIIVDGIYSGMTLDPNVSEYPILIITDGPIVPGMSGSAILDSQGNLAGLAFATFMKFPQAGYGIPINSIKYFLLRNIDTLLVGEEQP